MSTETETGVQGMTITREAPSALQAAYKLPDGAKSTVMSVYLDAEPLQRNDDFLAELAAAEQHHPGRGRGERGADVHGEGGALCALVKARGRRLFYQWPANFAAAHTKSPGPVNPCK